jgi:hypothetical protein
MFGSLKIVPFEAVTPRNPPRQLASKAVRAILFLALLDDVGVSHQGLTF